MEHPFNETQSGVYSLPTTFHLLIPSCKRSPIQGCMNRLYRGSFIQLLCNDRLFQAILCCKFFKFRKRIHNCLIGYTICKSHITGACEGASRYHKDVIFLTGFTEGFFVFNRRFYKEIEGTLWFDALKSAVFQAIIKCLPIFIISCKISLGVYTFCNYLLDQGRCIYTANVSFG